MTTEFSEVAIKANILVTSAKEEGVAVLVLRQLFKDEQTYDKLSDEELEDMFIQTLRGSSQLNRALLERLCADYNLTLDEVLAR